MGAVDLSKLKNSYETQIEAGKQRAKAIINNQDFYGMLNTTLLELCVIGGELQLYSTVAEDDVNFKSDYTRAAIIEKIINKEVYVVYSKATDLPYINDDGMCLMYTDQSLAERVLAEFEKSPEGCYMNAVTSGDLFSWINFHYHYHGMHSYTLNYPISNFILNVYTLACAHDKHALPEFVYEASRMWQEIRKAEEARNQSILEQSRDKVNRLYRKAVFLMPVSVKDEYGNVILDATREQLDKYGWTPFTAKVQDTTYIRLYTNEAAFQESLKGKVSGSLWLNATDLASYDKATDYQVDSATISHYVSRKHLQDITGRR